MQNAPLSGCSSCPTKGRLALLSRRSNRRGVLLSSWAQSKGFLFLYFFSLMHSCNCPQFLRDGEICIHILWILIKKMKLSPSDPLLYQQGLVEREIQLILQSNYLLHGFFSLIKMLSGEHQRKCVRPKPLPTFPTIQSVRNLLVLSQKTTFALCVKMICLSEFGSISVCRLSLQF